MDKNRIIGVLVALLLLTGLAACGKKSEQSPEKQNLNVGNALQKYGDVAGKTFQRVKGMDVLIPLRRQVETFKIQEGRNPYSLQELVEKGYVKELPQPPDGKKLTYNPKNGSVDFQQ